MKTGELIISLAEVSGVELDADQTKAIQEIATDLPDEIATQIKGSLFTKESALANPDIINRLKADTLDPVDEKLKEFAKTVGLGDGFIHQLGDTKGTYKRIESVTKAVLDHQKLALEKAKEGAPVGEQKELQVKIKELNDQLAGIKDTHIAKTEFDTLSETHKSTLSEHAKQMLSMKAKSLFSGVNWAMDGISPEINTSTAMALLNSELTSKEVSLVDENGTLKLQTKEGTPYYSADNKIVTPKDMVNSILSGHKLLKVTGNPPPTQITSTVPTTPTGMDASVAEAVRIARGANEAVNATGTQV